MAKQASTLVFKVKHGDILRRFSANVMDDQLGISMGMLIAKIRFLFKFETDTEVTLTYIDEDGDKVTLVDDDDLRDVVRQALNPLRITVTLNGKKSSSPFIRSTGSSTPLRTPLVQQPFQDLNSGVSEIFKNVSDPLRESLAKLSTDLASKMSSSAPGISPGVAELLEHFSKVGMSYLDQISESQTRVHPTAQNDIPGSSITVAETNSDLSEADPTPLKAQSKGGSKKQLSKNNKNSPKHRSVATMKVHEVKVETANGGSMEASSSKASGIAVPGPIKEANEYLCDSAPFASKSRVVPDSVEKEVNNASGPHLGPNLAFVGAHDHMKSDSLDGTTRHIPCDSGNSPHSLVVPNPGSFSNFTGSFFSPVLAYEYPVSGIPVENISAAQPQHTSQAVPFERNRSQNDGNGFICHYGVGCPGCGRLPIIDPRFRKSKLKVDYDLCSACFAAMGNENDYNRIVLPAKQPDQWPSKQLHDFHAQEQSSLVSQVHRDMEVNHGVSKLDSRFILDVTMIDGTIITPLTPFTKIWRMRNNGTVVWPEKTLLVWIGGHKLSNALTVEIQVPTAGLAVNQELDVAVDFISPELPGQYISHWSMAAPSGQKFGQRVWVLIEVDAAIKETQHGVPGLNLNLPPVNSVLTGPEIISVDMEPLVERSYLELDNTKKTVEVFEPITLLPNFEQGIKFHLTDSSMVGSGATNLAPTAPSSSLYPVIDQSAMALPAHYPPPPRAFYPTPAPAPAPPPSVIFPPTSPMLYTPSAPAVFYPLAPPPPSLLYPPPPHVLYPTPPPPPAVIFPPRTASLYTPASPALFYPSPPPAGDTRENAEEEVENKLLRELEEMGFDQVDLNKELLRLHEYDLQLTVDDLCDG